MLPLPVCHGKRAALHFFAQCVIRPRSLSLTSSLCAHMGQIHAHPAGPKSFNGACFEAAKAALEGAGHQVKALSLYEEKFQPALTHDDFRQYM